MLADAGSIFSVFGNDAACGGGAVRDMDLEHPDVTAMQRYGYPTWAISYTEGQCDELAEYIEEEKWGDRIPGGWDG